MSVNAPRTRTFDRVSALGIAVAAALWTFDAFFRPSLTAHLGSIQIVLLESLIISLFFLPFARRIAGEARHFSARTWLALVMIAAGPQAVATVLFTQSLTYNNPDVTYLLYMLQPVFALLLARVVLAERRKPYFWPLAAVALVAAYVVSFPNDPLHPALAGGRLEAAAFVIGAVALWGAGTVFGRFALENVSFLTTASLRFVLALPVLLVLTFLVPQTLSDYHTVVQGLTGYAWSYLPSFLAIAIIPGVIAMLLYYRSLRSTPASLATIAELAYPVTLTFVLALPPPVGFQVPITASKIVATVVLVAAVTALNLLKGRDVVEEPRPHELLLASATGA